MLQLKNGFYAFETALHVFPITSDLDRGIDLEEWNSSSLWREGYQDLAEGLIFFGEDVFQDQFCISSRGILRFSAESGKTVMMANSLERWAEVVLADYKYETGWTTASQWQAEHGSLPNGKRLMPRTPFFLGGQYSLDNLWAGDAVEGMRVKADLAMQTRNLSDGTKIKLQIEKKPGT